MALAYDYQTIERPGIGSIVEEDVFRAVLLREEVADIERTRGINGLYDYLRDLRNAACMASGIDPYIYLTVDERAKTESKNQWERTEYPAIETGVEFARRVLQPAVVVFAQKLDD